MAEVITLSSDEEENVDPPKKRVKLTTLSRKKPDCSTSEDASPCIILSDDDDEMPVKASSVPESAHVPETEETAVLNNIHKVNEVAITSELFESKNSKLLLDEVDSIEVSLQLNNSVETEKPNTILNSKETIQPNGTTEIHNKLFAFLNNCIIILKKPSHREQLKNTFPAVNKYFEKLTSHNCDFEKLSEMIDVNKIELQNENAIFKFSCVYKWLKSTAVALEEEKIDDAKHAKTIKKLETALNKILRIIKELDEAEVDLEDEDNSKYIQACRYKERAVQIHKKLCHYRKEDPNQGRLLYRRLNFNSSNYKEINEVLNRKYKNNMVFPSYYDLDKCIRKCVQQKNITISEGELKVEVRQCFEKLGNLLQKRRKVDLLDTHNDYLINSAMDPAKENSEMNQKLNANFTEANKKMQEIENKYVALQEKGVNPNLSSDSEDSKIAETTDEEDNKNVLN